MSAAARCVKMVSVDLPWERPGRLRLNILGPAEARLDGLSVHLTGRQRALLVMLALAGGHVVSVARLAEGLWENESPTAPARIRALVAEVRRALGDAALVRTTAPGYRFDAALISVDSADFARTVEQARASWSAGGIREAARLYDEALALWRGPALGGAATGPYLSGQAQRLDDSRLDVLEARAEARLALGEARAAITDLEELAAQRPPRDRAIGLLMVAHYRSGRSGQALRVYQHTVEFYRNDLGLDPSPELADLHRRILQADPALAAPSAVDGSVAPHPVRPAQLPPDLGDFTGRDRDLELLLEALADGRTDRVVAVHGRPGVGKSTLATHAAHRLRARFPDGQLYVDLDGVGPHPADPNDVLGQLLASLGIGGARMPTDTAARAGLFRSMLADRRMLLLLDNAASPEQIRFLLPAAFGCAVVVTSRTPVAAALGARGLKLDLLDPAASRDLIAAIIGPARAAAEPDALDRLVALCGRLPLALRVAAGRLAESPHWQVATMVERLADEHGRPRELHHGGLDLNATLQMSHRALSPLAATGLRLLGVPPAGDFARWTLAALLGVSEADAGPAIDEMICSGLLDYAGRDRTGEPRYRLHDLIRSFAVGLVDASDAAEIAAAEQRLFGAWLAAAASAAPLLPCRPVTTLPGPAEPWPVRGFAVTDAIAWFESERPGLRAVTQLAAARRSSYAYRIAAAALKFAELRGYYDDGRLLCQAGLAAATACEDHAAAAFMRCGLATMDRFQDRFDDARQGYIAARASFATLGDPVGEAIVDVGLAVVHRVTGDVTGSIALSDRAATAFTALGDEVRSAQARYSAAVAHCDARSWDAAAALLRAALPALEAAGDRETWCRALGVLGFVHLRRGELIEAQLRLERSVAVAADSGLVVDGAYAQATLSQLHAAMGQTEQAHDTISLSLGIVRASGDRSGESRMLIQLAEICAAEGRVRDAIELAEQSVEISRAVGNTLAAQDRQAYVEELRRTCIGTHSAS